MIAQVKKKKTALDLLTSCKHRLRVEWPRYLMLDM